MKAVIKSNYTNADGSPSAFKVSTEVPGRLVPGTPGIVHGGKLTIVWNEKNNFTAEVPVEIRYTDDFGQEKVHVKNWAQQLLDNYKLELVEEVDTPAVTQPEPEKSKKKGRSKNEV